MTKELPAITNREELLARLEYVAEQAGKLGEVVLQQKLAFSNLTVFAHDPEEHRRLLDIVESFGPKSPKSHGLTAYIMPSDLQVANHPLELLGVRAPDTTRPQAGYADFKTPDFDELLKLSADDPNITPVTSGARTLLIELKHPEYNVLVYAVAASGC